MGYDCTLHVIDAERIRAVFCARADVSAALAGGDPAKAAHEIARAAIQFSAAELPAHYERGFCLSLWGWRMEDDAQLAEVPKKLRGSAADLDALFAPLVEAHPRLKGRWPLELSGNGSVGIYVPAEKVPGLLKWARRKVASYPKPDRRVFRGLLRVLAECERRGLAYWEGSEVATISHPLEAPADERADWLEHVLLPRKGSWRLTANVAAPPEPPLCVLNFLGLENFLTEPPGCALADLKAWPPAWVTLDEALTPCDRGRDGRWIVVSRREADENWRSAPRAVELREAIEARGQVIEVPMSPAAWNYLRWQGVPESAASTATPAVAFVGMVGGLLVVLVRTGNLPPILGGPGNDAPLPPFRPHVWRGGRLSEADELPASVNEYGSSGAAPGRRRRARLDGKRL